MIFLMTTSRRPQQRFDHRLRELVRETGNVTIDREMEHYAVTRPHTFSRRS